jgi:hypothetical protein
MGEFKEGRQGGVEPLTLPLSPLGRGRGEGQDFETDKILLYKTLKGGWYEEKRIWINCFLFVGDGHLISFFEFFNQGSSRSSKNF